MITPVSRVRTCIIGAGASARKHLIGWQAVNDAQVVALVDVDESRAAALAQEFGIGAVGADYHAVIARPDINIVSLCTPSALHGAIGLDAVSRHKHVLCERGITHAPDECDTLLEAARSNRVAVGMMFPRRYQPSFARIREMLGAAALGRPAIYRVHCAMPAFNGTPARGESQGMDVFLDLFADHYDLWTWLFRSEATRVTARGFNWADPRPDSRAERAATPDTGVALIEFGSGDLGVVSAFCGMAPVFEPFQVHEEELIGPQGMISEIQATQFTHRDQLGKAQEYVFPPQSAYTAAIQDFANRIRRGEPPRATGEDGKRALRVGLAVCESMETGATIDF